MKAYSPKEIEKKWQEKWEKEKRFEAESINSKKEKKYFLIEFPYPSGEGLHVGHPRPYTGMDVIARKARFQGKNVLFPIGFDAFGLPTENYAIKNKIHPREATQKNIANFVRQLKSLGFSFDWSRVIDTTEPSYYKWTQYIFLKFFEKNLAYKAKLAINWCPSCLVGLANEEVSQGKCERCHSDVIQKEKKQWMLKITEYADSLIEGLKDLDFVERTKTQQINWIGKSTGLELSFPIKDKEEEIKIYTTRPDTIYGVTYMVIAPEHPLLEKLASSIENIDEIRAYRNEAAKKSSFDRVELAKDKTGIKIKSLKAINPISKKETEIWVSDYVMMNYGTGAIMAVPAHDKRDYEFAKKFQIEIIEVISGGDIQKEAYIGDGKAINSELINGLDKQKASEKIIEYAEKNSIGERKTNFKLRDWVFSRQRYWGEPIPIVHCDDCKMVPIPENELPLELPKVESYQATSTGESPLAAIDEWVNCKCPKCGKPAKRETDTMPQWAGSSWYFLRYVDPKNSENFASEEAMKYWMQVDWYNGGMEHTTLHLLYSRFWNQFLYDIGLVPYREPYLKRTSHGMILAKGGGKMSKSLGNVVNPDDVVENYGADTLRLYEMFIGDFEKAAEWNDNSVGGCRRFLDRVWNLSEFLNESDKVNENIEIEFNNLIKKVSEDYENLKFNTAIAAMMAFVNTIYHEREISKKAYKNLLILLNPICPHITEEIWEMNFSPSSIHDEIWPEYDKDKLISDDVEIAVQVNGKLRDTITVPRTSTKEELEEKAKSLDKIKAHTEGKNIVKIIVIPQKIVNIVVK